MWFFVSVYFLASNLSYLRWPIRLMRVYTHWPINGRPHWYLICLFYEVFFMCFLVVLQHIDYWFLIFCFNITIEIYFSQRLNVLTHHRIFDIFHKTEKRMPRQKAAPPNIYSTLVKWILIFLKFLYSSFIYFRKYH